MHEQNTQDLVRLLTQHHGSLSRYIYALLGNAEDANDVLQETSVALFKKLEQFDSTQPFLSWAYRFAYLEVLKWRQRNAKKPLLLDEDVIELLARQREQADPLLTRRMAVLPDCFKQLPKSDLQAIRGRYLEATNAEVLATRLGLSKRTLFRELERIRRVLMACIDTKLAIEEF